ncbi:hypothetical protein FHT70_005530 [Rhizobium sp. BK049]|nr:hypothetical protein [Rhizobium sp. BK049]
MEVDILVGAIDVDPREERGVSGLEIDSKQPLSQERDEFLPMREQNEDSRQALLPIYDLISTIVQFSDNERLQAVEGRPAFFLARLYEVPDIVEKLRHLQPSPAVAALVGGNPISRRGAVLIHEQPVDRSQLDRGVL